MSRPPLVLEPVALAGDLRDVRVVEQSIKQSRRERGVVGEGTGPLRKRQVAGENHAAVLVALRHDVEEQRRLFATEGQVADLVDDEQTRSDDGSIEVFLQPSLALRGGELQHEVRRRDEACLDPGHHRSVRECHGDVTLADPARAEQHDVLGALDEGECGQFLDLRPRSTTGEGEVELLKRFDDGQGCELQQRLPLPRACASVLSVYSDAS